ncbi:MAG: hypothetical protein Q7S44_02240 [bacterium]|nr:hypothetical protein [bacterium]
MKELAYQIPGYTINEGFPYLKAELSRADLGTLVSQILNIAFLVVGFLMLFWAAWGVFQYIFAGGNKEGLAKARSRITWAIVGFIIVMLAFAISQYLKEIFPSSNVNVPNVTKTPI